MQKREKGLTLTLDKRDEAPGDSERKAAHLCGDLQRLHEIVKE
jgi:hypothetical protein